MIRARFHANLDDPRPIKWPVKHPYWVSAYGADHAVVVAYADSEGQILELWPEATNIESTEEAQYEFTGRFPKPSWFTE